MIGSLRGTLLDRDPAAGEALVEAGGVGYRIQMTATGLVSLPDVGDVVFVHVHHHIREADQQLFGFLSIDERKAFEALLSAHGVGPALALAIVGIHLPNDLRLAVATDDVDALCLVPGVGKKTAARLLIELKNKLDLPENVEATVASIAGDSGVPSVKVDVREALVGLGYSGDEIRVVLAELPEAGDVGVLVREALQRLGSW
jgi:Holliday junction DNA helicase RuvA